VPVLHFVLVPAFLLAALLSFIFTYKKEKQILQATAKCPACFTDLNVPKAEPNWPLPVTCPSCGAQIYVQDAALEPLISISTTV